MFIFKYSAVNTQFMWRQWAFLKTWAFLFQHFQHFPSTKREGKVYPEQGWKIQQENSKLLLSKEQCKEPAVTRDCSMFLWDWTGSNAPSVFTRWKRITYWRLKSWRDKAVVMEAAGWTPLTLSSCPQQPLLSTWCWSSTFVALVA